MPADTLAASLVLRLGGTVGEALASVAAELRRAGLESARAEARHLLGLATGLTEATLLAHPEMPLSPAARRRLARLTAQRAARRPFAYVAGRAPFWTGTLAVGPGVLVPRPETEVVLEEVLGLIPPDAAWRVVDLGTGSGCLAVAVAAERPRSEVLAVDVSARALAWLRRNVQRWGVEERVLVRQGQWWE
ncbi:MAG: peptide chain release factor N(5)-glutamine methyltransferase, partial [Clostridia bacterium]|nr:peptide chain release factor N(5)-glutamine methyltransferase [Clostridia bacterium]